MISIDFHQYPPKAEKKTEHPLWVHGDPAFLVALQAYLIQRHNSRYPTFIFVVRGNTLGVQIHLEGEYKAYFPGEYSSDFTRIIDGCLGFEAGWMARRTEAK